MASVSKLNGNEFDCDEMNPYQEFSGQNVITGEKSEDEVANFEKNQSRNVLNLIAGTPTEVSFPIIDDCEEIDNQPVRDEHRSASFHQNFMECGLQHPIPSKTDLPELYNENEDRKHEIIVQTGGKTDEKNTTRNEINSGGGHLMNIRQTFSEEYMKTRNVCMFSENCEVCGTYIADKLEECQIQLDILKIEKKRLLTFKKKLTKEKEDFQIKMDKQQQQNEIEMYQLRLELEGERKKILAKEQAEKPKRAQRKKEMREMMKMKIELDELKEQMNERLTKNAVCIANLRNHIKILEKNNMKLQEENDQLQREKTKLAAQFETNNKTIESQIMKFTKLDIYKSTEKKHQIHCSEVLMTCESQSDKVMALSPRLSPKEEIQQKIDSSQEISIEEKYNIMFREQDTPKETENKCDIKKEEQMKDRLKSFRELGKTETLLENGSREIRYPNGDKKLISDDCIVRYYYANNDIWHINFPDGTEVIEFPNGQCEKRYKDGKCLIFFPDGLIQILFPNGTEQIKYPDGTKILTNTEGDRMLFLPTGQVEIHTKNHKTREYPDGTVKIVYADGSEEKKYSNGRIKITNCKGEIVLDTGDQ